MRGWWKEGFHGVDREALRTILDEMIGLGILRSTLNGAYSLRNLNIVQLMGSAQDIEAALLQEREMPTEYEPSSYRSNLGGIPRERRSPLTVQQEGEILSTTGVFVAVACEAAGNDALAEALVASAAMHKTDAMHLKSADDVARFLDEIGSRTLERSLVTIVACGCWSPEQVTAAAEKTARLRSRKNNFAVVFVADPPSTWDLLTASKGREALENTGVRLVTARPWHDTFLGKWLDDLQAPSDRESRVLVRDGTGNWPRLIDQLLRQAPDARLWVARLRDGWRPSVAPSLFGISKDVQTAVLRNLSELESAPASDLAELYQGDRSEAQRVIEWAEIVGLTESDDDGALVLNPSVRHLFPSA